jgi:hypothetical protein
MVAQNTAYVAPKNAADPKTRVGDFFYEDHASVGQNRWANRLNTQEKSCYHYETASGRSNWPNRDPIEEWGGPNVYGFVFNNPIAFLDILGGRAERNDSRADRHKRAQQRRDDHRNRNQHNNCPEQKPGSGSSSSDDIDDNCSNKNYQVGETYVDGQGHSWVYEGQPALHGNQDTFRGTGEMSGSQCSYDKKGDLDDKTSGMGSADFVDPYDGDGEFNFPEDIDDVVGHFSQDVVHHFHDSNYTPGLTNTY